MQHVNSATYISIFVVCWSYSPEADQPLVDDQRTIYSVGDNTNRKQKATDYLYQNPK